MKSCQFLFFFPPKNTYYRELPSNSWKKNEKMSETSLPEIIFFSSRSFHPNWLPPGHRHCPSILFSLLLLLLHEAKEDVEKTGKIETGRNYNYFLNLVMEISFLTTSLQSKEDFDGFCFYFRRAGCSFFTKIRQDFGFYALKKKNYWIFSHGCWANNISVVSAAPHGGDLLDVQSFLLVEVA